MSQRPPNQLGDTDDEVTSPFLESSLRTDSAGGDEVEEDWAVPERRRIPPLSIALVAATFLAVAFIGGVLVQKHHDRHLASGATGLSSGLASLAGGLPTFSGQSSSAGTSTSGSSGSASSGPAVIGKLISVRGNLLTVRNLGGKRVHVLVPSTVSTNTSRATALGKLTAGSNIEVDGTTASTGVVHATAIVKH